jgi:hypothetical protein
MKKNVILVVLLASSFVFAANNKKSTQNMSKPLPALPKLVLSTDGKNPDEYKTFVHKKMEESQKLNRQIAQTDTIDEKGFLSESFIQVRNQFFAVQSAEQFDAFINKVSADEYFSKLDRDGQFLALQFLSLKPYKSFTYRAATFVGRHSVIRSAIITNLRLAAVAQKQFNSTPEQKAIFDFITMPLEGMGSDIDTDSDMENFINAELRPATEKIYLKYIDVIEKSTRPIHWDNKVYASFANFSDSADRYAQIGLPEQYLILAGIEQTIAGQLVTSAYSLEGFSEMINRMAKEFGIDSMNILSKVDGLSAKKRFEILKKYPHLFTLKSGGAGYTKVAYDYLKASLQNTKLAWSAIQKNQNSNLTGVAFAINPQTLMPFGRQINAGLSNLDNLFSGSDLSSAVVNGDKINISFEKLFSNPPASLSQFYPVQFNNEKPEGTKTVNGKLVKYRNYLSDSSTAWNYQSFKAYAPNLKSNDNKTADVSKDISVLSQVWGANILGFSISGLVF